MFEPLPASPLLFIWIRHIRFWMSCLIEISVPDSTGIGSLTYCCLCCTWMLHFLPVCLSFLWSCDLSGLLLSQLVGRCADGLLMTSPLLWEWWEPESQVNPLHAVCLVWAVGGVCRRHPATASDLLNFAKSCHARLMEAMKSRGCREYLLVDLNCLELLYKHRPVLVSLCLVPVYQKTEFRRCRALRWYGDGKVSPTYCHCKHIAVSTCQMISDGASSTVQPVDLTVIRVRPECRAFAQSNVLSRNEGITYQAWHGIARWYCYLRCPRSTRYQPNAEWVFPIGVCKLCCQWFLTGLKFRGNSRVC